MDKSNFQIWGHAHIRSQKEFSGISIDYNNSWYDWFCTNVLPFILLKGDK